MIGRATLEALPGRAAAFGASPEQAQEAEPLLRADRREFAQALADFVTVDPGARIPAEWAEPHRLLVGCGLRDLPRDPEDEKIAGPIRGRLQGGAPPSARYF